MKTFLCGILLFLFPLQFVDATEGMVLVDETPEGSKLGITPLLETAEDIPEKVGAPGAPKENKSIKRKRERLLQDIQSALGEEQNNSAIVIFPISNKKAIGGDPADAFAQALDRMFFKEASRKVLVSGVFAGLVGCVPPHPSCGYVIDKTGNFLQVPISSLQANLFISWIVITTTPAFAQQFFNMGKDISSWFLSEGHFDVARGEEDNDKPHIFKKRRLHYAANVALVGSTLINAAIPTILMRQVEIDFPVFVGITFFPFYLAWAESYFKSGYTNIHNLFTYYSYASKINYQKREILKEKILDFQRALDRDAFVLKVFDTIQKEKEDNFPGDDGSPFAFSALFLKNAYRMSGTPETEDESTALLLNYRMDVEASAHTAFDGFSDWFNSFLTGAGTYTRYYINQNVLSSLFLEMGCSSDTAFYVSTSLAAFEAGYRLITSHDDQKDYLRSVRGIFKRTTNLTPVRKVSGVVSFVNGCLFSLPILVAGLSVYKDYSLSSKIGYLAPAYLLEMIRYGGYFSRQSNDFVDSVSVARSTNLGIISKRAYLKRFSDKALYYMDHFDVETIEHLYKILQHGT